MTDLEIGKVFKEEFYASSDSDIDKMVEIASKIETEVRIDELGNADIAMDYSGINETEEWEEYYKTRMDQLRKGVEG